MKERLDLFLKAGSSLLAAASFLAWLIVPRADPAYSRHLVLFFLLQAALDLAVIAGGLLLILCLRRSSWLSGVRRFRPGSRLDARTLLAASLGSLAIASLLVPGYYIARARQRFWRELAGRAYAEYHMLRIDAAARAGRVQEAYELTVPVNRVLQGSKWRPYLQERQDRLALLLRRSRELAGRTSMYVGYHWNPVADRGLFFRLAEAVRLNPQNYAAAEVLGEMVRALTEDAIPKDEAALCSAASAPSSSLPRLDFEVRLEEIRRSGGCADGRGRRLLREAWSLDRVDCILALSRATRATSPPPEDGEALLAGIPECRPFAEPE